MLDVYREIEEFSVNNNNFIICVAIALYAADILTTFLIIRSYGFQHESNPIIRYLYGNYGWLGFVIFHVFVSAFLAYYMVNSSAFAMAVALMFFLVAANNIWVTATLARKNRNINN